MKKYKKEQRIYGHILQKDKQIKESLTKIFGIGRKSSHRIIQILGYSDSVKITDLSDYDIQILIEELDNYNSCLEKNKRKRLSKTLKHYESNKSIKGFRLKNRLPVRGQRTHTNAKTVKRLKKNF